MPNSSAITGGHLARLRAYYDRAGAVATAASLGYRTQLAHYYNLLIPAGASVLEIGCGAGELLARIHARRKVGVDLSAAQLAAARARVPEATFHLQAGEDLALDETFDFIVLSDTLNLAGDAQQVLERLHVVARSDTRLILNYHSLLWRPALAAARRSGLAPKHPEENWLTANDVKGLLRLADWEPVHVQPRLLTPFGLFGLGALANRWLAPLFTWCCLCQFCVARPTRARPLPARSVSVVIPARNEAGNIEAAVQRTPMMGTRTEIIFVEGNSTDGTWAEIQRVKAAYPDREIKAIQQSGSGKGDAVRAGFAAATGEILMILDADLTMPPEELPKFFNVLVQGRAEFVNGCRLVYPMDERAMQFLNLCANKAFGLMFTWLLGQPVKDTLCGTKVLSREHYERIAANRSYFGDFDPFGDFDLLFGAAKLNLKIVDVPIRYKQRTYGTTNIHRWRHGWLLLRMVCFAARKLKFV